MGKKAKRGFKRKNASNPNRSANPQPLAETHPSLPQEKKSLSWKIVGLFSSLIILVIGFLGYDALWPKVVINSSAAVDSGMLSYQFEFGNQPSYPVKILTVIVSPKDFFTTTGNEFENISFRSTYDSDVQIGGRESVIISLVDALHLPAGSKPKNGSKIVIRVTYRLPFLKIEKTDSTLFEIATDISGNPIWIKKPIGEFENYKPTAIIQFKPKIE